MSENGGVAVRATPRPALSILIKVRGAMPSLRPAEQRVAEAVLADPAAISESSITAVARQCLTSETTVLRFCRAIGLAGYPELRIALARAAQWEESDHNGSGPHTGTIEQGDSLADIVSKITYADARAIEETGAAIDLVMLEAAVDAVTAARRIDIYGIGSSGLVGYELHQKLHRIGVMSFSWSDSHLALASASGLSSEDLAIGISYTGTTVDTIDALGVARSRGARTLAVTNFAKSPISAAADLLLVTANRETTFRSGAMASRTAQFALVDCLYAGVAQRSYSRSVDALLASDAAIRTRHGARIR